jgi:hypothetical protein
VSLDLDPLRDLPEFLAFLFRGGPLLLVRIFLGLVVLFGVSYYMNGVQHKFDFYFYFLFVLKILIIIIKFQILKF